MKSILAIALVVCTQSALAAEVRCLGEFNSDYELRLIQDDEKLVQIAIGNLDHGGYSELQPVTMTNASTYVVCGIANAGLREGDILQLNGASVTLVGTTFSVTSVKFLCH